MQAIPIRTTTAAFDYDPQTDEEIPLQEGCVVRIYTIVDANWSFVKVNDVVGLVPSSYLEPDSVHFN